MKSKSAACKKSLFSSIFGFVLCVSPLSNGSTVRHTRQSVNRIYFKKVQCDYELHQTKKKKVQKKTKQTDQMTFWVSILPKINHTAFAIFQVQYCKTDFYF